jgi:hypothetical protein
MRLIIVDDAAGDPQFANVVLLLHFDGGDGSSTFVDSSVNAFSRYTADDVGNPPLQTTAQAKFGTSSVYLLSTAQLVYADDPDLDIGTGDFTYECFVRLNSTGTVYYIAKANGTNTPRWAFGSYLNGLAWYVNGSPVLTGGALSTGVWMHIAAARSWSTLKLFLDGVEVASGTDSNDYTNSDRLSIGSDQTGGTAMNGYVDELRITAAARYTANFTPPTSAFPHT